MEDRPAAQAIDFGFMHSVNDQIGLELAKVIAAGLPTHPEWITLAKENLRRWSERNSHVPSLLRCYEQWRPLLDLPVAEIQRLLTEESERGQELRQNSPFAGALSPKQVWAIKRRCFDDARAA